MVFCFPPLFLRAYMILLGSPGIIPLLEGLMLITPAKRPALCQAPCSRVLSTEVWISLGGRRSPATTDGDRTVLCAQPAGNGGARAWVRRPSCLLWLLLYTLVTFSEGAYRVQRTGHSKETAEFSRHLAYPANPEVPP